MKLLYPLTFKYGELVAEKISEDDKLIYHFVATSVLNTDNVSWYTKVIQSDELFVTTPIFKKTLQETPNHIANLFTEWSENKSKIVKNGEFNSNDSVILVNVQGKGRYKQIGHLAEAISILLEKSKNTIKRDLRIILLVNNLPNADDIQYTPLIPFIKNHNICIVDKDGITSNNNRHALIDIIRYNELDQQRINLNYDIIAKKIIRKIGHFQVKPTDENCNRYFYDGSYCDTEISELILNYIFKNLQQNDGIEYIIYSSKYSPWLEKALSAADGDIKADFKEELPHYKKLISINELLNAGPPPYDGGNLLIVVDFVNTGRTLINLIEDVYAKFELPDANRLHLISVLNNIEDGIESRLKNNKRKVEINNIEFEFTYFADVKIKTFDSKTTCDCCKLGMKRNSPLDNEPSFSKFKSVDFWFLADNNGYKAEDNFPDIPQREPLEIVPRFEDWLRDNSTYLAFKLRKFIESYKLTNSIDFIIVFPEDSNEEKNVAHEFALKLKELFKIDVIGIPRKVIDLVKQNRLDDNGIRSISDSWAMNINRTSHRVDFVILDEFHNQGGTFAGVRRILNAFAHPAKSYFVLADFNPSLSATYIDTENNFLVYSLYEFNYD